MNMNLSQEMIHPLFYCETDLHDIEQECRSLIEKHISLEHKWKETQLHIQEITLAKLEVERLLANDRRELTDVKAQLKLIQSTMQQWEQDHSNIRETSVRQNIQIESITNERDILLENIKKLQVENMEMKMKIDENDKVILSQKSMESLMQSNKTSMNLIFQNISKQSQKLESEQNALKKSFVVAKTFGEHMVQLLKQHHKVLNETYAENNKLKEANTSLLSELNLLKERNAHPMEFKNKNNNNSNQDHALEKHLQKCDAIMKILNEQISKEVDEKMKLQELFKKTLYEQDKFCEREHYFKTQILELEKTVEKFTKPQEKLMMNVSVQTEQSETNDVVSKFNILFYVENVDKP